MSKLTIQTSTPEEEEFFKNMLTPADVMPKHIKPEWNGEGLPPVGVKCEKWFNGKLQVITPISYFTDEDNYQLIFYKNHNPKSSGDLYDWCYCGNCDFKNIETPEHKAARIRKEAISEMVGHACKDQCIIECARFAESLYDVGYRKQ